MLGFNCEQFLINSFDSENGRFLMEIANSFDCKLLKSECEQKMINSINSVNVCGYIETAIKFSCQLVKSKCIDYIKDHCKAVFKTNGWKELQASQPQIVIEILQTLIENGKF